MKRLPVLALCLLCLFRGVFADDALRLAIDDLAETFGAAYPGAERYRSRLAALEKRPTSAARTAALKALRHEALLANPLLDFERLVVLKRKRGQHGLPVNHKCNTGIPQTGYDNEIAVLSPVDPDGSLKTLFRPQKKLYVGEFDLNWDAERLLFTMPDGRTWQIHEIRTDGTGLRQVSREDPKVDNFDPCYLPGGQIVFASTASWHAVPCWHGKERACAIYRMDADGSNMRQLCFDQDLDLHPAVLNDGRVVFSRWDYTGILHMYLRPLMAMNPDGTNQRALYGSNSYWPNSLYYPQAVPGRDGMLVTIVTGYHGPARMGVPALIDTNRGWHGGSGVLQLLPGRGKPIDDSVKVDQWYARTWPKFLNPVPLAKPETNRGAGTYFLVAMQPAAEAAFGIYLIDVFDNIVPLLVDGKYDFFEPLPVVKRDPPPVIPDAVDPSRDESIVYLDDVYAGPGLNDVPRGTIKSMRVVAYHFGYPNLAGPDKVGLGGPWEVMRILGTVQVAADGSAAFRVPANTPLALQPLDGEGKAVQLMRSWFTAMPGETLSCVGCHEQNNSSPRSVRPDLVRGRKPSAIEPWYGPARGFDFEREVQPVLDTYCASCHDGASRDDGRQIPDLRSERFHPQYTGHVLAQLGAERLHSELRKRFSGPRIKYTPAYEALIPYVRRVGIEDDVFILPPGEYHADTSELIQMLTKGHHGVKLDGEAWDRLVTWIDLNAPCHGTWGDIAPIPGRPDRRRWELSRKYGGPAEDFETVPVVATRKIEPKVFAPPPTPAEPPNLAGWPLRTAEAQERQRAAGSPTVRILDLGEGVSMKLTLVPAGEFLMGDVAGDADEQPVTRVRVEAPFWIGACEVTNRQYRRFEAKHRSGYFTKRYPGYDGPGLPLDGSERPVIRVSWNGAMAFCRWLSEKAGKPVTLPTEAQWEYACRAGTATSLPFGGLTADFSRHANMADRALTIPTSVTGGLTTGLTNPHYEKRQPRGRKITGIMKDSVFAGDIPAVRAFDDKAIATANVGRYRPNTWGLHDMCGNVAEWTRSTYAPYPYRTDDGREGEAPAGKKVVRGGSFRDRPKRCRSAFRLAYPAWQRVHNVGFRVVVPAH